MESFTVAITAVPNYGAILLQQPEISKEPEQLSLPLLDMVAIAVPSPNITPKEVTGETAIPIATAENTQVIAPTGYSAYIFHKVDAATNCRRSYMIAYQPSFFNEHCLVRQWGRIGSQKQRIKHQEFETGEEALAALKKAVRRRLKRGYILANV